MDRQCRRSYSLRNESISNQTPRTKRHRSRLLGETTLDDRVIAAVSAHPAARAIELVGSRAAGTPSELSDWDFALETDDFVEIAQALPSLLASLEPIAQQWDPLSRRWCWMAILRGPAKVDLIFVHEAHEPATAWQPGAVTLPSIDTHFWDWMLWLSSKEAAGKDDLVDGELTKLFEYILHPLGVEDRPMSVVGAVESYRHARGAAEKRFRRRVPRDLEDEVFPALELQRA